MKVGGGRYFSTIFDDGVDRSRERIKARILLPFALLLVFLIGAFILTAYRGEEREFERNLYESARAVERLFDEEREKETLMMHTILDTIIRNEEVKAAFLARDRETLYRLVHPLFEDLRKEYGFTHFYFTGPDRVNFLRVHAPDRHGDVIDRLTTIKVETTGEVASGIEIGPLGTLTMRTVIPWRDESGLIGFVELGHEIWHFAEEMKHVLDVDMLLLDYKKFLDREGWEEGMKIMGHRGNWGRFPTTVAIDWTMDEVPKGLVKIMEKRRHPHLPEMTVLDPEEDGRTLIAAFLPIYEWSGKRPGREVGDFAIIRDVTGIHAAFRNSMFLTVAISLLAGGGVFFLFYLILDRVEGDVRKRAEELSDEIAERKRAEEALREAESRYRALFFQSPDAIVVIDPETTLPIDFNDGMPRLLGLTREEFSKTPISVYEPTRSIEEIKAHNERILRKGEDEFETQYRTSSDEIRNVIVNVQKIEFSGKPVFHTIVYDITEAMRVENDLRQSEEHYRSGTASAPDAIISADERGCILSWNEGAKTIFGYEEGEVQGKTIDILMPERHREAHRKGVERLSSGGEAGIIGQTIKYSGMRKNGEEFPLELSLSRWKADGKLFFSGIIRDLGRRKRRKKKPEKKGSEKKQAEEKNPH